MTIKTDLVRCAAAVDNVQHFENKLSPKECGFRERERDSKTFQLRMILPAWTPFLILSNISKTPPLFEMKVLLFYWD